MLNAQAAGGSVTYDGDDDSHALPAEHALIPDCIIAQERTADLMGAAEQGRLGRHARTVEPNRARPGLRPRLVARLRTWVATSATGAPAEDH